MIKRACPVKGCGGTIARPHDVLCAEHTLKLTAQERDALKTARHRSRQAELLLAARIARAMESR